MIKITDKAKDYLTRTAINQDKPYVRFSVKGGGCAGFKYEWNFADDFVEDTIKFDLNDLKKECLRISKKIFYGKKKIKKL